MADLERANEVSRAWFEQLVSSSLVADEWVGVVVFDAAEINDEAARPDHYASAEINKIWPASPKTPLWGYTRDLISGRWCTQH